MEQVKKFFFEYLNSYLTRPPDPAGEYSTNIVTAVEEKKASDGGEIS